MADVGEPIFGEAAVSWRTVWDRLYPEDFLDPHDDEHASEMHRLRGLIMAQAAETEAVLGIVLSALDPEQRIDRPAGQLLRSIGQKLSAQQLSDWSPGLATIEDAIKRRNHAVHRSVEVGSSWAPYATGFGGDWVPVITLMGGEEYDESDLLKDLAVQHRATCEAVRILRALNFAQQG